MTRPTFEAEFPIDREPEITDKAKAIIRKLLKESTFPAMGFEDCRSCTAGHTTMHDSDCPYLVAVTEANAFLEEKI